MRIDFLLNWTFAKKWTLWARCGYISNKFAYNRYNVYCRDSKVNKPNIHKVSLIFKLLDYFYIFLNMFFWYWATWKRLYLFERFLLKQKMKWDIIHSWGLHHKLFGKYSDKKIVLDVHMTHLYTDNKWYTHFSDYDKNYDMIDKYVNAYIAPSKFTKKSLISLWIKENKVHVVPFGVDSVLFVPNFQKENKIIKYIYTWIFESRKWIDVLIKAWIGLWLTNAELILVWRTTIFFRRLSKQYNLNNLKSINVISHVDHTTLAVLLKNSHVYVFPSLKEWSAKSIYEAMASWLPIITTENAGSVIRNGKDWLIIKENNVKDLKEKILYFYENQQDIVTMWKSARQEVEKYTWEKYSNNVLDVYKNL